MCQSTLHAPRPKFHRYSSRTPNSVRFFLPQPLTIKTPPQQARHFTLSTPHFTLSTPHFPFHTLVTLHTSHSTLHTPHFTVHTSHSTPHFTLHTPHFTVHTSQSTLQLHTPRFTATASQSKHFAANPRDTASKSIRDPRNTSRLSATISQLRNVTFCGKSWRHGEREHVTPECHL